MDSQLDNWEDCWTSSIYSVSTLGKKMIHIHEAEGIEFNLYSEWDATQFYEMFSSRSLFFYLSSQSLSQVSENTEKLYIRGLQCDVINTWRMLTTTSYPCHSWKYLKWLKRSQSYSTFHMHETKIREITDHIVDLSTSGNEYIQLSSW